MNLNEIEKYTDTAVTLVMGYAPKIVLALITLLVGFWLAGRVASLVKQAADHRKIDPTLTPFLASLINWSVRAAVLISVASIIGIQTTSFVAVLGAAGLAIGLALQGSLSNFAGGALILIFRPYRVGDLIRAQGELGVVKEIQIFTTTLLSPENRRIVIPNGPLANGNIVNFTAEGKLRVDLTVGISYGADIEQARRVLLEVLKADERVLTEPAPMVEVAELADSSVNLAVRPHTHPDNYWGVYFDTLKNCKLALDQAGVSIPFPQRDVHLFQHKG
jgi:small conductance mechanosensitive channel